MSSILDALERAKREREQLERGRAGGGPDPASATAGAATPPPHSITLPRGAGDPPPTSRAGSANPSSGAPGGPSPHAPWTQAPVPMPWVVGPPHGAAPQAAPPPPSASPFIGLFLAGIVLGGSMLAAGVVGAYLLLRPPAPAPGVEQVPIIEAAPTPAPTPAPDPTPLPAPPATPAPDPGDLATGRISPTGGIIIEDIRFADVSTSPDLALHLPRVVLTPAPTPVPPAPRVGDAPTLLDDSGAPAAATPTPTPTPSPTPAEGDVHLLAEDFTAFKIDAILYSAERPVVMIRGRERREGDTVERHRILRITADTVVFEQDGRRIHVRF